jgi:hypothetical protein
MKNPLQTVDNCVQTTLAKKAKEMVQAEQDSKK